MSFFLLHQHDEDITEEVTIITDKRMSSLDCKLFTDTIGHGQLLGKKKNLIFFSLTDTTSSLAVVDFISLVSSSKLFLLLTVCFFIHTRCSPCTLLISPCMVFIGNAIDNWRRSFELISKNVVSKLEICSIALSIFPTNWFRSPCIPLAIEQFPRLEARNYRDPIQSESSSRSK